MKFASKALIASLILVAGVAIAKEGVTNPDVIAREDLMDGIAKSTKTLGDMATDKADFDATAAAAAKATLIASAAEIPAKFKKQADDPLSEAKPSIWTDWADFEKDAKALGTAADAIDVSSLDGIKAGMGAIGGACKDCHTEHRLKR